MSAVGTEADLPARIEEHFDASPRERRGLRRVGTACFGFPAG